MTMYGTGRLAEPDRKNLVRHLANWPEDFDGSAHVSIDGQPLPLDWPESLDAQVIDGRLQMTFTRPLSTPVTLAGRSVDVGFYESTYFFAFSIANASRILPAQSACAAKVIRFDPETAPDGLLNELAALDREETPKIANVGALFADRITLTCD